MKINLKLSLAALAGIFLFGMTSCEDITELNVDPNSPTQVPAVNLVVQAQYELNDRLHSRNYNAEWTMLVTQMWSQVEYAEESRFVVDGNSFNDAWIDLYANVLSELNVAKGIITEDEGIAAAEKANQLGIISILEAYTYHALVDGYGNIPFSAALQPIENPLPSYDSQEAVYTGIVSKLQAALASMDAGAASFAGGEPIYNGDARSWIRFGNSLLMRVALRMSDVDEVTARSVIGGIGELITDNSQNAIWAFDANPGIANPLFIDSDINGRDDFGVSDVLVNTLTEKGDPRISAYAALNVSDEYVGMPSGLPDAEAFALSSITSRPAAGVRAATAPAVMMDAAEVNFMLAEAYQRGLLDGDAAAAYDAGVTASMNFWGFSDADAISTYLAANAYDAANWKESVGVQKWLAFYMNGPQAWAEWRRLDQPELVLPAAAVNDVIPVRLPYPVSEQTRNGEELGKVTSNPNDLSTKLWWDVN